jgi:hypothetical protein
MNKQYIRLAAYVLLILGLIGIFSEVGPPWGRYVTISLGIFLYALTLFGNYKK